jgi:hypothetical protein
MMARVLTKTYARRTIPLELRVVSLYKDHGTTEIARITNLSETTVKEIRLKYHLPMRQRPKTRGRGWDRHKWFRLLYGLYWEQGKSQQEIAKITGVPQGTICNRMQSLGIATRNNREQQKGRARPVYKWSDKYPLCVHCRKKRVRVEGRILCGSCTTNHKRDIKPRIMHLLQQVE